MAAELEEARLAAGGHTAAGLAARGAAADGHTGWLAAVAVTACWWTAQLGTAVDSVGAVAADRLAATGCAAATWGTAGLAADEHRAAGFGAGLRAAGGLTARGLAAAWLTAVAHGVSSGGEILFPGESSTM